MTYSEKRKQKVIRLGGYLGYVFRLQTPHSFESCIPYTSSSLGKVAEPSERI